MHTHCYLVILIAFTSCSVSTAPTPQYEIDRAWVRGGTVLPRSVTLCTHLSLDRWPVLLKQARLWGGPVSATLFLKGAKDAGQLDQLRESAERAQIRLTLIRDPNMEVRTNRGNSSSSV